MSSRLELLVCVNECAISARGPGYVVNSMNGYVSISTSIFSSPSPHLHLHISVPTPISPRSNSMGCIENRVQMSKAPRDLLMLLVSRAEYCLYLAYTS